MWDMFSLGNRVAGTLLRQYIENYRSMYLEYVAHSQYCRLLIHVVIFCNELAVFCIKATTQNPQVKHCFPAPGMSRLFYFLGWLQKKKEQMHLFTSIRSQ